MKKVIFPYQIFYDAKTHAKLDPVFLPLDNSANPRPDWREYWPIRNFFISNAHLDENAFYGFLSPKFREKTGLSAKEVIDYIEQGTTTTDIFSFSPYFDQMAMFINIFEQGNAHHPGLTDCVGQFFTYLGLDSSLLSRVGDSRNTIFCNYFFAKPSFWRQWLAYNEALFALCEADNTELAMRLNRGTEHAGTSSCPLKVFIAERTVSLLLLTGRYTTDAFNPIVLPRTNSPAASLGDELVIADALKQTFVSTGNTRYLDAFIAFRNTVITQHLSARPS